jgi:hypothetical protein
MDLIEEIRREASQYLARKVQAALAAKDAEIAELRAAAEQVYNVCCNNAAPACNQAMALAFVRNVVVHALEQKAGKS